jgi:phage portal protein BeeE
MALWDRIIDRLRRPQKMIGSYSGSWDYLPLGFYSPNQDITFSKAGVSAAYCTVYEVNACVQSISDGIDLLDWNINRYPKGIRRGEKGEPVANRDDLEPRHDLADAFNRFRAENNMGFLVTAAIDYLLYGEVYFEKIESAFGRKELVWLNPLGMSVDDTQGYITWFRYGWNAQYVQIPPERVAYLHNRNTNNDYVGLPTCLTVLNEINIARNLDRFQRDHFQNNARPGMILTPVSEESIWSDKDYHNLLNQIKEKLKGVGGQYNTLVSQHPLSATTFEQPDIAKNVTLNDQQSVAIYEAFGVPRAMRGNTSVSPYKSGDEVIHRFYMDSVLPLARKLQPFINTQIMPFFDNSGLTIFEFDMSPFDTTTEADRLEAEVVSRQIQDTLMDLYTAAEKQEIEPDPRLQGLYMVQGVPVPIEDLRTYWQKQLLVAPSVFNAPEITGEPLPEPTDPEEIVPTPEGAEPLLETDELADIAEVTDVNLGETKVEDEPEKPEERLPHYKLYNSDYLFPSEDIIHTRLKRELHAWKRYECDRFIGRKNRIRVFKTDILPPWIRHEIIDRLDTCRTKQDVIRAFDTVLWSKAIKTISSYQRELRDLARGLWNGSVSMGQFQTGMERAIDREFRSAFVEGVQRGGIAVADLTDDERNRLDELVSGEKQHIDDLSHYIYRNRKDKGKFNTIRTRVDGWVARYLQVKEVGFLIAKGAEPLLWKFDPRKEHCRSCGALNGQVRRAKFWLESGISPKSPRLECFGIHCGCQYEIPPEGTRISRGRLPRVGWRN